VTDISILRAQILETIDRNGRYLTPPGFTQERLDTGLHLAMRSLRSEGKIRMANSWPWEEWVRTLEL
jgi:hypothetical protein